MFSARAGGDQPARVPIELEVSTWNIVVTGRVTCGRCWRPLRIDTATTPGEIAEVVTDHQERCARTQLRPAP